MTPTIRLAGTDEDVRRCHPVMVQLRPRFDVEALVARVREQRATGYRLALLEVDGAVAAAAGYRFVECLAWGRAMYVDDLVTDAARRSRGYGLRLIEWLTERAREAGCDELHLDSGVQRFAAHRFYLRNGFDITSHHFAVKLR